MINRESWAGIALDATAQIWYNYGIIGLINIDVFGFTDAESPCSLGWRLHLGYFGYSN